jgi:hypothetical protein
MLGDPNRADFLSPPVLLSAEDLDRQKLRDDEYGRVAEIASMLAVQRVSLKSQKEKAAAIIRKARAPAVSAELLYKQAEEVAIAETKVARELQPTFDDLTAIVAVAAKAGADDKINRAIRRYAEEAIDIGISFLELILNHRLEMLRLASEKGKARPIVSSADELEREFARLTEDAG